MNVWRRELRLNRRGMLIWMVVVASVILVYLGFFPYMLDPNMVAAVEAYPEAIREMLSLSGAMLQDVNLYHGGLVMTYVVLLATIYATMLAGGLLAREADLGTAEFLYTRPVTRTRIMLGKVLAFTAIVIGLWAAGFLVSLAVGMAVARATFDVGRQALVHLAGLAASLAAGGIGFAVSPFLNRTQATTSLGVGLGMAFFLLNGLSRMTARLSCLKYLTVFHYADLAGAAAGKPSWEGMLVLLAVFGVATGLGFAFLNRKDFAA